MLTAKERESLLRDSFVSSIVEAPRMPSTNDEALARCRTADPPMPPLLVLTDHQDRGRGRGGKEWYWEEGALTFSIAVDNEAYSVETSSIPLLTGVAVCRACSASLTGLASDNAPRLKWPNDLLIGRKKFGGILVETLRVPSPRTVIGIGLNVNQTFQRAPADIRAQATSLRQAKGDEFPLFDCLQSVLQHLQQAFDAAARDPEWLVQQWPLLSAHHHQWVSIQIGARVVEGYDQGIAASGALQVDTGQNIELVFSGSLRMSFNGH